MNSGLRDKLKQRGIKRFIKSFSYALDGIRYAFKYEQNLFVHILVTIVVIVMGIIFHITLFEWVLCIFSVGLVIATELINTSIEATIDLVSPDYNELAKIAKDTAAAAVMVFAFTAVMVGLIIFVPYILQLF